MLASCSDPIAEFPYQEYVGNWNNIKTTVNGIPDDMQYNSKTPHYVFGLAQSEATLHDPMIGSYEYQYWKVDKTTSPYTLFLYKVSTINPPNLVYQITQEPYQGSMVLSFQDTITYYLKK